MTSNDIIAAIHSGSHDKDMAAIFAAVSSRKNFQHDMVAVQLRNALRVGSEVYFNRDTRPNYLIGAKAKVIKVNSTTARVQVIEGDGGRFGTRPFKSPLTLLSLSPIT